MVNENVDTNLVAEDLLRESLHRLYWKAMVNVVGEEKAETILDSLIKKEEYTLTTGQMIDHLKEGEVAEDVNGWQVAFNEYHELNIIGNAHSTVTHGLGSRFYISGIGNDLKWKIHKKKEEAKTITRYVVKMKKGGYMTQCAFDENGSTMSVSAVDSPLDSYLFKTKDSAQIWIDELLSGTSYYMMEFEDEDDSPEGVLELQITYQLK